jgi:hypothetical protein
MFVQVIQGKASNVDQLRVAVDTWRRDVASGATGWLGSTGGVTDDGRFIVLARFESEDAARRNSDRPEQDRWWSETARLLDGDATFRDSTDVTVDLSGDPDRAGFVQVMQGRSSDPDRAKELMSQDSDEWAEFRPEVLGTVAVVHEAGAYTVAIYFTSEAEARDGERKEPPGEIAAQMAEMDTLNIGEPEFFDLREPWLHSPQ